MEEKKNRSNEIEELKGLYHDLVIAKSEQKEYVEASKKRLTISLIICIIVSCFLISFLFFTRDILIFAFFLVLYNMLGITSYGLSERYLENRYYKNKYWNTERCDRFYFLLRKLILNLKTK